MKSVNTILFYISGHGFGHVTRESPVIYALRRILPHYRIAVRSPAPIWFLQASLPPDTIIERAEIDVGVRQLDSLNMEREKTLHDYTNLIKNKSSIIASEARWCIEHNVKLIVADIPPFAFDIARAVSVPSICIANFAWDWIYAAFLPQYPAFAPVIDDIKSSHSLCALCLTTPLTCDLSSFPHRQSIPLICRQSAMTKEEARFKAGLPPNKKILLFSFGGFGLNSGFKKIPRIPLDTVIVSTQPDLQMDGFIYLSRADISKLKIEYWDLVRAADAVITKPGYGIVAECLANQTPIIYTEREGFPEYDVIVKEMKQYLPALHLPQTELLSGNWHQYLEEFYRLDKSFHPLPLNGAETAAGIIGGF